MKAQRVMPRVTINSTGSHKTVIKHHPMATNSPAQNTKAHKMPAFLAKAVAIFKKH